MPIYEFECEDCGERFEELVAADASASCPACGADGRRLFSGQVATLKMGLRGGDARRSDATRKAREEVKRQEFSEKRRRQREQN